MSKVLGGCLCKSVRFECSGSIQKVVNCHCTLCRKMNGAAFSTYAVILESDFNLVDGEVMTHSISDSTAKHFCGLCGTPIYNTNSKLGPIVILHIGSLDRNVEILPDVNIYCDSKLHWVDEITGLPNLPQGGSSK